MDSLITMMKPVEGGIYVSDKTSVKFFRNDKPEDLVIDTVDASPAIYGSAVTVPGGAIHEELATEDSVVVWLSKYGHIAGLPNGKVVRLNPGQLKLPGYTVASGTFVERDGVNQVINPVNSDRRDGTGTAIDSEIL
jgi:hypothetical protein